MVARTVLAIMAHPDDAELTCGGTIVRWVRDGARAILVVASDGARGGKLVGADAQGMARTRQAEQEAAARVLGFDQVVHLNFADGDLVDDDALRGALVEQVRRFRPDAVIVMDPLTVIQHNSYVNHRDHRMLGMATLDALYPEASNAFYFSEQIESGLQPHKVPELLLVNTDQPNYWVDVSDTLETRFNALRCHHSQIRLWPDNGEAIVRRQRELAALTGLEHGMIYAEAFRRVVVDPLS